MVTLNDALMDLVTKKLITPEEGYSKAIDKAGHGNCHEAGRNRPVEAGSRQRLRPSRPARRVRRSGRFRLASQRG